MTVNEGKRPSCRDEGRIAHPILTINAWNEWAERRYLEPGTVHGLA